MWTDNNNNHYKPEDIMWISVDNPACQFSGYVTKTSYRTSNCVDDWIVVYEINKIEN